MSMSPPPCFGSSWSPNAVECKGGLDPTYTNPRNGSHLRDKCLWYGQCATKTNANSITRAQPMVSPQQLLRPAGMPVTVGSPVMQAPRYPMMQQMLQVPQMHMMQAPQMLAPPHVAYYGPQAVPTSYQQPGMQVLAYLAIPEPVDSTVPWWKRLLHEVLRSMAKSFGHTVANAFDHMTITKPRPPV